MFIPLFSRLSRSRNPYLRALLMIPTSWAVAYFVFWACAPAAVMPPPLPNLTGLNNEAGLVVTGGYPSFNGNTVVPIAPNAQLWYNRELSHDLTFQVVGFGGYSSIVGAGIGLRYMPVQSPRFRLGFEAQAGWLYGRLGMPVAISLSPGDKLWFYTDPSVQLAATGVIRIPVGLAVRTKYATWSVEAGMDTLAIPQVTYISMTEPFFYGAFGASVGF